MHQKFFFMEINLKKLKIIHRALKIYALILCDRNEDYLIKRYINYDDYKEISDLVADVDTRILMSTTLD